MNLIKALLRSASAGALNALWALSARGLHRYTLVSMGPQLFSCGDNSSRVRSMKTVLDARPPVRWPFTSAALDPLHGDCARMMLRQRALRDRLLGHVGRRRSFGTAARPINWGGPGCGQEARGELGRYRARVAVCRPESDGGLLVRTPRCGRIGVFLAGILSEDHCPCGGCDYPGGWSAPSKWAGRKPRARPTATGPTSDSRPSCD